MQAALADTKLPAVEVLYGEGGEGDPELELSDDPGASTRLDTSAVPLIVTVARVRGPCHHSGTRSRNLITQSAIDVFT